MSNTHDVFIQLPEGGSAFISGVPDECDHVWNGDTVYRTASGKTIYWHTYRQWAGYTSQLRDRLIYELHYQSDDPIVEGGVSCSKCKKPFHPGYY